MADTTKNVALTPLHLQLIEALAQDAVRRGLFTDPAAVEAFLRAPADGDDARAPAARKPRDGGHDLNRRERLREAGQRLADGIDHAATFAESWAGIFIGWAFVAALAWHRWPLLEVVR